MVTIVIHKKTDRKFLLLGTGFGAYKSHKPQWIWGDVSNETHLGEYPMMCICDFEGNIGWVKTSEMKVISVDGEEPHVALGVKKKASKLPSIQKHPGETAKKDAE